MREAGFEPANPKDDGLSDAALTTNRFAHKKYLEEGRGEGGEVHSLPPISHTIFVFKLFSRNQQLLMRIHNIQPANV